MKKRSIIIISLIVILVLVIGGILLIPKIFVGVNKEAYVTNLTKEFYGYYYDENAKTTDIKKFLANYKDSGLKISLGDLEVYLNGKKGKEGDYKLLDKCDVDKTYATIYPKSPYGKKDITVKVELSCSEAK